MTRPDLVEYASGARAPRVDQQMLAYLVAAAHTVATWTGTAFIYRTGSLDFELSTERPQHRGGELLVTVRSDAAPRSAAEKWSECPNAEFQARDRLHRSGEPAPVVYVSGLLTSDAVDGYLKGIMGEVPEWGDGLHENVLDTERYRKDDPGGEDWGNVGADFIKEAWKL